MKLVRLFTAIPLLFSLSVGLFVLQIEGYQGFGRTGVAFRCATHAIAPDAQSATTGWY